MTRGRLVAGWIALVRRRWGWGVAVGTLVLAVTAYMILSARPVYRADARLRLASAPPSPGVPTSGGGGLLGGFFNTGGDPFSNDLEVLASRTLAERVTEENALNVRLGAPRGWHRDSLFTAVRASRDASRGSYRLEWQGDGSVIVRRLAPTDSLLGHFATGEPIRFEGVELVPGPRKRGAPDELVVATYAFAEAAQATQARIQAVRPRREANVLELRIADTDPKLAREVLESVVNGFIALRSRLFERESGETVDSLRGVADRTRAELAAAEASLVAFQTSSALVAADAQSEEAVRRLVEAEVELETARQDLSAVESMLARSDSAPEAASSWTALVAHPRFLENETIGSLLTRLTVLEEQRTALAARRSESSTEYRTLLAQMRFLETSLRSTVTSYRTAVAERIGVLDELVGRMRSQLAAVPDKAVELNRGLRQVRILTEVLINTEQRLRQEELREALAFSNVQVIDPAQLEYRSIWPRKKLMLAVGLMLAFGFAMLAMIVVDSADATVRSAAELSTITGAPVVAALPSNGRLARPADSETHAMLALGRSIGAPSLPPIVVAAVDGNGGAVVAEGVREVLLSSPGWVGAAREVIVAPPVVSYAAARAALGQGGPLLLVVVRGRTALPDVERAVRLLREAGGGAAGMVVMVGSDAEAGELWT
jgi:uncharacterized protein involved in exopolysaccharide biosynthesis